MRIIWKYQLSASDDQILEVPQGAKALTVQLQYGKPCLWFIVDPEAEKEKRRIIIQGAGIPMRNTIITQGTGIPMRNTVGNYIGTYQLTGGFAVFHVFDVS